MSLEDRIEYLSPEGWRQWQLELLQSTLNRVYQRVPFYRKLMEENGIRPEDIGELEDLKKLPFTTREHLAQNYPYDLFAVPLRDIVRLHAFPGPKAPIVKGFTSRDLKALRGLTCRFLTHCGVTSEDIVQICLDPGMSIWIEEIKEGAETLGALVIPPDPQSAQDRLRIMHDFRTSVLISTPSYALHLLHYMQKEGLLPPKSLRLAVLVGEEIDGQNRLRLEQAMNLNTRLGYGITEVIGPGMGYECEEKQGYHLAADYFLAEIIDPKTLRPLPPGQIGELVVTTLSIKANPLIRFRTGDLTQLLDSPCPCGRTTPRIGPIVGRCDGRLSIRGIKISLDYLEELLREVYHHLPAYCLRIKRHHYLEELELWLAINEQLFEPSILGLHRIMEKFQHRFNETFGLPCRLKLVEKEHLDAFAQGQKVIVS